MKLLWEVLLLKTILSLPKLPQHGRAFPLNHSVDILFVQDQDVVTSQEETVETD